MQEYEGLLALTETQVWGVYSDTAQRKIAVERARASIRRQATDHGRVSSSRHLHRAIAQGLDADYEWVQWVNYKNLVEVLKFTFGIDTVTGSNPYTHTYSTTSPDSLPNFNIYVDEAVGASPTLNLCGCKVGRLEFNNDSSGILQATVRGTGKSHRRIAALSVSASDDTQFELEPFIFSDLTFSQALNGATRTVDQDIESLRILIDNNLVKKVPVDSQQFIIEQVAGFLEVSGDFSAELEDWSEFDAFVNNQQLDISAVWISGIYSLTVTIANARITASPLPEIRGTSDRGTVRYEFRAIYDATDTLSTVLVTDVGATTYPSSSSSSQSSSSSSVSSESSFSSSCCSSSCSSSSESSESSSSSSMSQSSVSNSSVSNSSYSYSSVSWSSTSWSSESDGSHSSASRSSRSRSSVSISSASRSSASQSSIP